MGVENVAEWIEGEMRGDLGEDVRRGGFVGLGISIAGSFIDARSFNTPSYLEEWAGIDVENILRTRLACRSEERRVGKECVSKCRSGCSPCPSTKNTHYKTCSSQIIHIDNTDHNQ